jgi:gamma-glutamyltranspeptidase / glutathione hydrolase
VIPIRILIVTLAAAVVAFPTSAGARTSQASNTAYSLSALALLGPDRTDISLTVTSATGPLPEMLEKVQVKVWPVGDGEVETRNFFDVPSLDGVAILGIHRLERLQRVRVRAHVKDGSQNVLEAETAVQYRALGAVSSDDKRATAAGEAMLKAGGNAFDAAAAMLFVLNVTQPHLAGIGGSSNVVLYSALDDQLYAIDARETAPLAATADMFGTRSADELSVNGYSVGVPGTLLAVERMLGRWGTMSLGETLEPAIGYAEHGIQVGSFLARDLASPATWKAAFPPETKELFSPGGIVLKQNDRLVQPDLATTFRLIARDGSSVFYRGEIARAIVEAQHWHTYPEGTGRMTIEDLAGYDVVVREPSHIDYRGYDVYAAAPSSSGGMVLLEALGLLEDPRFPLGDVDSEGSSYAFGSRYALHATVEALRLALADRVWVGDPAFHAVPETQLLSDAYLRARSALIQKFPVRMTPTVAVPPGDPFAFPAPASSVEGSGDEAAHTTHFSVIDSYGNSVSFTTTMADSFGSGILVPGYGFLLNDSLRLFRVAPTQDPEPGKRPAGSMTPVVLMKDGEPVAATGTYGSVFIPSLVLNIVLDLIDYDIQLQEAVDASRLWISNPDGAWTWNHGRRGAPSFPQGEIEALWALGPRRPPLVPPARDEVFGSLASVGVDQETVELRSAADDQRQADAGGVVVQR